MKASVHFTALLLLSACGAPSLVDPEQPQAVRATEVRIGPVVEGRSYLAEVVTARTVRVLAQVPGTVTELVAAQGASVQQGDALVRISAPDVAARFDRVEAERARAQRERDFACGQLATDRILVQAGDISPLQLDQSDKACTSAEQALNAAGAARTEAAVAGGRSTEHAPFAGEVLAHLVDPGQTVMPGTPLVLLGSRGRQLRLRLPSADLATLSVGSTIVSPLGSGQVVEIGAQTQGPGRLVEVLAELDGEATAALSAMAVGSTLTATVVRDARLSASAVPAAALADDAEGAFVLVVEDQALRRVDVARGPGQDGWVAIEPSLAAGTVVVARDLAGLDLDRPVLAVLPSEGQP